MNKNKLLSEEAIALHRLYVRNIHKAYHEYYSSLLKPYLSSIPEDLHDKVYSVFDSLQSKTDNLESLINIINFALGQTDKLTLYKKCNNILNLGDFFPSGLDKNLFYDLCDKMYNVSKKGVGKGEILVRFLLGNTIEASGQKRDLTVHLGDGSLAGLEIKAETASYKNVKDSSFRILDALNKNLFVPGENYFNTVNQAKSLLYLSKVHPNFLPQECDKLNEIYSSTVRFPEKERVKLRKLYISSAVMSSYKRIDGHDFVLAIKKDEENKNFIFTMIADTSDVKFIFEQMDLRPQLARGGGVQALGDGYVDGNPRTPKQVLKAKKKFEELEKLYNV